MPAKSMDELVSLSKRRGFIFQSADVYGGSQGLYDFGPLGVELKNNLKAAWWRAMVYERDDVEGLDSTLLTNRRVLQYSGHEQTFSDPMVDCRRCKSRWRADQVQGRCPGCGADDLTEPRPFNLMFKTTFGPIDDGSSLVYLRPETAQGIFTNFKNVLDATSRRLPFGIAQMGKAFRNEITPRNFIFRVREFEMMELEFFVPPGDDEAWHRRWLQLRLDWWETQGVRRDALSIYDVPADELAHYSKATYDIMYPFPHGLEELEGIANRGDFDLGAHSKNQQELALAAKVAPNADSKARLAVRNPETGTWTVPYVIEPSTGVERGVLALMNEAYRQEQLDNGTTRTVLGFKPHLAPVKVAVLPLKRNHTGIVAKARAVKQQLQALGLGRILYEHTGNIGKGYRRHDEVGTPMCVTVDFQTIEQDDSVTVRDRDTMAQQRVPVPELGDFVRERLRAG